MTREEWRRVVLVALAFGAVLALALSDAPAWSVVFIPPAIAWPLRRPIWRLAGVINEAIAGFVEWYVRGAD